MSAQPQLIGMDENYPHALCTDFFRLFCSTFSLSCCFIQSTPSHVFQTPNGVLTSHNGGTRHLRLRSSIQAYLTPRLSFDLPKTSLCSPFKGSDPSSLLINRSSPMTYSYGNATVLRWILSLNYKSQQQEQDCHSCWIVTTMLFNVIPTSIYIATVCPTVLVWQSQNPQFRGGMGPRGGSHSGVATLSIPMINLYCPGLGTNPGFKFARGPRGYGTQYTANTRQACCQCGSQIASQDLGGDTTAFLGQWDSDSPTLAETQPRSIAYRDCYTGTPRSRILGFDYNRKQTVHPSEIGRLEDEQAGSQLHSVGHRQQTESFLGPCDGATVSTTWLSWGHVAHTSNHRRLPFQRRSVSLWQMIRKSSGLNRN
jgi:hypothetical protein